MKNMIRVGELHRENRGVKDETFGYYGVNHHGSPGGRCNSNDGDFIK